MPDLVVIEREDLRALLEESCRRVIEDAAPAPARPETAPGAPTVRGLDPHALYSRRTLAERWDCSTDTVASYEAKGLRQELDWPGQVRYRGADVLRFEGVPETEIMAASREPLPILASPDRPTRPGRPPKAGALPQI